MMRVWRGVNYRLSNIRCENACQTLTVSPTVK
jgi:hypothetical protein